MAINKLAKHIRSTLLPAGTDKHTRSRLLKYITWLGVNGGDWTRPDLAVYRDNLLVDHSPVTVAAHLSTIRGQYRRVINDNDMRDQLYSIVPGEVGPADKKAFVDEAITRMENAIDPRYSKVTQITHQDRPDEAFLRLTRQQAEQLLNAPGVDTLQGRRDTAIIALLLCTGIREAELCSLDVLDLRQHLGGELALHIRQGKGCKERLVVYGDLDWCLVVVDAWMKAAVIFEGPVFRGYYNGYKIKRDHLSVRAVEYILQSYPISVDGELVMVHPHDCRRTYARRLYEAGMPVVAIQQNLGHANMKTTLGYIGPLDAHTRKPARVYSFDLGKLAIHAEQ